MIDLGALKATITLNDDEATSKLKGFSKEVENTGSKIGKFAGSVGGMAKTLITGLGGAVVGATGAMVAMSSKALETTANIEKFSATCNVSSEEFQRLDGVFQTVGWSMENAAGDFAALSEKMLDAAETGEGEAYEMFSRLGVAVEDSSGKLRNTGDVFNDMILALQNVSDSTERQAIASIMLGTTSEELAPILQMTNEEFLKMKDNVNVISDEQLEKANSFKKSWDLLKQTFSTVVTELGVSLMPMLQSFVDWIVDNMPVIQETIEIVFKVVGEVINTVSESIENAIAWFNNLLSNNEGVKEELTEIWNGVKAMFSTLFKELQELLVAFTSVCTKFWEKYGNDILSILRPLWVTLKTLFETGFNVLISLINVFTALFNGDFEAMSDAIKNIISSMWEFIKNAFKQGVDVLKNLIPLMVQIGKDMFNGLWNGLKETWSNIKNWVSNAFNGIIEDIKNIFDIHSPSRVMKEIGNNITQGMVEGVQEGQGSVKNSMSKLGHDALNVIRQYYVDSKNMMTEEQLEQYNQRKQFMQNYIDDQKYYNKLTLDEEYNLYLGMKELAKGNKEEITYWEKELYRVKQEMREEDIQNLKDANSRYRELYLQQVKDANLILTNTSNAEIAKLEEELEKMDAEDKKAAYEERYESFEKQIKELEKELALSSYEERKNIEEELIEKEKEFDKWLFEEDRKRKREELRQQIQDEKEALDAKIKNNNDYAEKHLAAVDKQLEESIKAIESGIDKEKEIYSAKNEELKSIDDEHTQNQRDSFVERENALAETNNNIRSETSNFANVMYQENYGVGASFANGLADGILNQTYRVTKAISMLVDGMKSQLDKLSLTNSIDIDGSHRNGLYYVPYDGYRAELHKGERVLTAEQSRNYSEMSTSGIEQKLEMICNKLDRLPRNMAIESRF